MGHAVNKVFIEMLSKKIDFIGVGSGKCGSTWLYNNIVKHPSIYDGNPKEINYFSDSYLWGKKSHDWYLSHFKQAEELVTGEFSVTYMYDLSAAKRIKELFPDAKIIVTLRDPVYRTHSDYFHSLRKAEISNDMKFSEYIKNEKHLEFGLYSKYLSQFYNVFEKEDILVLKMEDSVDNSFETFQLIYRFLGVESSFSPDDLDKPVNVGNSYRFLFIEQMMTAFSKYLNNKGFTKLIEKMKRFGIAKFVRSINKINEQREEISTTDKMYLREYFLEDNRKLELMTEKTFYG